MSISVSFHADKYTTFESYPSAHSVTCFIVRVANENRRGDLDLYLSLAQARELAETILAGFAHDFSDKEA